MSSASVKLAKLYDCLPHDAQRSVLETHLFSLLDTLPDEASSKVLSAITELQSRFQTMPKLDLKGKKKEITTLMDALHLDGKLDITRMHSNREELQAEVMNSLTSWLNDIWSVAYEFHDNYLQAHICLLFTADVARSLSEMHGRVGCKCALMNLPIDVVIKSRDGTTIKSFALRGPHALDRAVLWIWREIFLSLLTHGTASVKRKIPEMFEDIEMTMGWNALERLLRGGNSSISSEYDGFEDDDYFDEELHEDNTFDYVDEDDDEDYVDEDFHSGVVCSLHASHWPPSMEESRLQLRDLILESLHVHFCIMPSLRLFEVIRSISPDPRAADSLLLQETKDNAVKSSDTFAGALEIYVSKGNAYRIHVILDSHSHLLRPQDAEILQSAVRVLNERGYSAFGMQIFERELFAQIRAIHGAVTAVFGHIGLEEHKMEIEGILKLRTGSQERRERIQRWADSITTQEAPLNPIAFAAMMMGFPMGGPDGGPEDPAGFLDEVDENDPDFEDLREEFRPPLKERFDGWSKLSSTIWKDAAAAKLVLNSTYAKTVQLMPFLRASDVVEHMVVRLIELRGKNHVAKALQTLSNFCLIQRKKAATKQRRSSEKTSAPPAPSFAPNNPPFPFSFQQQSPESRHAYGGMEDVD